MDGTAISFRSGWSVYAMVPSLGVICRMGRGGGKWIVNGLGFGTEELGVSTASPLIPGWRDLRDVCRCACVGVESCGLMAADTGISRGRCEPWERCHGCSGVCWVKVDAATQPCGAAMHLTDKLPLAEPWPRQMDE